MKNATHRVVILKDCNSDIISQAIFFLKDTKGETESKILAEAEKIVEKYMSSCGNTFSHTPSKKFKKNNKLPVLVTVCAAFLFITVAILFFIK